MSQAFRVLIVEDLSCDADLAVREITRAIEPVSFYRVETRDAFIRALERFRPDLVVSDYRMPSFNGMDALQLTLDKAPLVPFIMCTGSINEDTAVECMKAGAADYVIKEHIKRLGPAVRRALEMREIRIAGRKTRQDLVDSENRFQRIAQNADDLIYRYELHPERKYTFVSSSALKMTGYAPEEYHADPDLGIKLVHPDDRKIVEEVIGNKADLDSPIVLRWVKKDGEVIWAEQKIVPVYDHSGKMIAIEGIVRDITGRKQSEDALRESEERFRALHNASFGGIAIHDKGVIQECNQGLAQMTGYKREELIGSNGLLLCAEHSRDYVMKNIVADYQKPFEAMGLRKNGEQFPMRVESRNIPYRGKMMRVTEFRDIAEQKAIESELIKAKEKAEGSDQLKSAFLANMSHEIRTPMNGILGFAELLKDQELTGDQQQQYISIIKKSGDRMLNIINDLVDISKIESGQEELSLSLTNINEQIRLLNEQFRQEFEMTKALRLSAVTPAEDVVIRTDREKLVTVLTKLLKNALKFTNAGFVEFGFTKNKKTLEFFVRDSGIGIANNKLESIFERFIQADQSFSRVYEGAGLGLSIARAYVEMLGGSIGVESKEGAGSCFRFSIPIEEGQSEKLLVTEAELFKNGDYGNRKLKVMIAEDDRASFMLISLAIKKMSQEILQAKNGQEAVEVCRENPDIDLILMDIKMPGMNGYEATREIRHFNPKVVIIAQTALALAGDKTKAIDAGCNDYISKPIRRAELNALIKKYF